MKKLFPYVFKLLSWFNPQYASQLAFNLLIKPRNKPRPKTELQFLKTGRSVTFDSGRKARTWGNGPVVWLLHGWQSQGSTFYKLIPLLVDTGHQVVAWDAPAHGASPGKYLHVPGYAKSVCTDIQQGLFEQPVAFICHSFGGAALSILAQIYKLPAKIVIASAPTHVDHIFHQFADKVGLSLKAQTLFIALAEQSSGYTLADCSLVNHDLSSMSEVLVIHDINDDVVPFSDFESLQKNWQSATFLATENLGHRQTIKDEKTVKSIVSFINKDC